LKRLGSGEEGTCKPWEE